MIMPKFGSHEKEIQESVKFHVDVIAYNEAKLVKKRWWYIFAYIFGGILSVFTSITRFDLLYRARNYIQLREFLNSTLEKYCEKKYSCIIWIKGAGVSSNIVQKFSRKFNAPPFLYLYDPADRYSAVRDLWDVVDDVFCFDPEDCHKYDLKYIPMFSSHKSYKKFLSERNNTRNEKNLTYVGAFTWWRFFSLLRISTGLRFNTNLVLVQKILPTIRILGVQLTSDHIDRDQLLEMYSMSDCLLELISLDQTGSTQRMSDSLLVGKPIFQFGKPMKSANAMKVYSDVLSLQRVMEGVADARKTQEGSETEVQGKASNISLTSVDEFLEQFVSATNKLKVHNSE